MYIHYTSIWRPHVRVVPPFHTTQSRISFAIRRRWWWWCHPGRGGFAALCCAVVIKILIVCKWCGLLKTGERGRTKKSLRTTQSGDPISIHRVHTIIYSFRKSDDKDVRATTICTQCMWSACGVVEQGEREEREGAQCFMRVVCSLF